MYKETKSKILTGTIQLESTTAVSMYAQKSEEGTVQMNINIQSPTLYEAYKKECDEDIKTFKAHVEDL